MINQSNCAGPTFGLSDAQPTTPKFLRQQLTSSSIAGLVSCTLWYVGDDPGHPRNASDIAGTPRPGNGLNVRLLERVEMLFPPVVEFLVLVQLVGRVKSATVGSLEAATQTLDIVNDEIVRVDIVRFVRIGLDKLNRKLTLAPLKCHSCLIQNRIVARLAIVVRRRQVEMIARLWRHVPKAVMSVISTHVEAAQAAAATLARLVLAVKQFCVEIQFFQFLV